MTFAPDYTSVCSLQNYDSYSIHQLYFLNIRPLYPFYPPSLKHIDSLYVLSYQKPHKFTMNLWDNHSTYKPPPTIQTPRRMALYAAYDACIDSFNSNLCLFFVVSVPLKEK